MVGLSIEVQIDPSKRFEFLQTFELMVQKGQTEKGCRGKFIYEKVGIPNCFYWLDCWDSDETLAGYRESSQFKALIGAAQVLGTGIEIKKIFFAEV